MGNHFFLFLALVVGAIALHQFQSHEHGAPACKGNEDVILYATSWCGYCKKARHLLNEQHVTYCEYDIETSTEGERQYNKLGGRGIPLLSINGQLVRGYDKPTILTLLNHLPE